MAKSQLGSGILDAHAVKLGPVSTNNTRACPRQIPRMTKVERIGSPMLSGLFGVHPNTDLLLQELRNCDEEWAPELEREENRKAAGEFGEVRVIHIDSPRCNVGTARDAGRYIFLTSRRPRSPRTRTKIQHGAERVFDHFMARTEEDASSRKTIWTVSRTRGGLASQKGIYEGQVEKLLHTRPLLAR